VAVPRKWKITRQQSARQITVTAIETNGRRHSTSKASSLSALATVQLTIQAYPGSVARLTMAERLSRIHPYRSWSTERTRQLFSRTETEITEGSHTGKYWTYTVTLSGPRWTQSRIQRLWRNIQWPAPLTVTAAVHEFLSSTKSHPASWDRFWLNRKHGWLVTDGGEESMGFGSTYLFKTIDGGKRWHFAAPTPVQSVFPGANRLHSGPVVAFRTPFDGWQK
jgi:hypothetical protein